MKRRWPKNIWSGLALVVLTPVLYLGFFIRYPVTRDVPWPSLLMFAAGLGLILHGLLRAYRRSGEYRGKIAAPVALTIGAALAGFFCFVLLYQARQVPDSLGAPRVGQLAPDFTLPDQDGQPVSLAQLLAAHGSNGVILVFYRGWW
jgi:hypothetical protein